MNPDKLPRFTVSTVRPDSQQSGTVYLPSSVLADLADECMQKYGNSSVWKACCQVFDHLNLAAVRSQCLQLEVASCGYDVKLIKQVIDASVLCVHGGLSPDIPTLDQVRTISRAQEVPHEGAFCGMSAVSSSKVLLCTGFGSSADTQT